MSTNGRFLTAKKQQAHRCLLFIEIGFYCIVIG